MPDIFRGIHLNPLVPSNSLFLLWMILGYLVVTSVLIVGLGRLGDIYGRVRIYNLGFVIYTVASLLLAVDWLTGRAGATYLVGFRVVQGIGGACLLANSAAIITDAFPVTQRGMALGINNIVGVSGMFIGLVLGGLLAPIDWRLVFLVSVPVGPGGHDLGLSATRGAQRAPTAADRLARQRHLRARADPADDQRHLRDPTLRRLSDRLGEPQGHRSACRRRRVAAGLRSDRATRQGPDVPAVAVPDPCLHVRVARDLPLGRRSRRADVHADHLAAGDLAPPARLQLQRHAALCRHLHAPPHRRHAHRRAHLGLPVRSLRGAALRDRGHDLHGAQLRRADAAANQLRLPRVWPRAAS